MIISDLKISCWHVVNITLCRPGSSYFADCTSFFVHNLEVILRSWRKQEGGECSCNEEQVEQAKIQAKREASITDPEFGGRHGGRHGGRGAPEIVSNADTDEV
jgi:hypothetical protein